MNHLNQELETLEWVITRIRDSNLTPTSRVEKKLAELASAIQSISAHDSELAQQWSKKLDALVEKYAALSLVKAVDFHNKQIEPSSEQLSFANAAFSASSPATSPRQIFDSIKRHLKSVSEGH